MKAFTDTLAHEVQSSEGDILRIKADLKVVLPELLLNLIKMRLN